MARGSSTHLAAICALLSFVYISKSLEKHSLTGHPRLSSVLILLFSGGLCFLTSLFSKWLPGAQGRFDGQQRGGRYSALPGAKSSAKTAPVQMPPRPRKLSLPVLALCIILRLEVFHQVNNNQQCSTPGVESFICVLLWAYETLSDSRKLSLAVPDDVDDPWRSVFTDIAEWLGGPRQTILMSGIAVTTFCFGTYLSVGQIFRSTYFCFTYVDNRPWVVALQVGGLLLDALIVILFWRMLAWARTTKLKLHALGSTLVLSSVSMALVWLGRRILGGATPSRLAFRSLYGFDIVVDSTIFAALMVSSALWICESATIMPATIFTLLVGLRSTVNHVFLLGTWEQQSRSHVLLPACIFIAGLTWFAYVQDIRYFIFLKRIHVVVLLSIFMLWITIQSVFQSSPTFQRHPLSDLIYKGHVEHDRWLRHATTSHGLPIAVKEYQNRHKGRNPPPFFHEWYKLAKDTAIVDEFRQIDRDLTPFRKLSPQYLRQRISIMKNVPGVATISIKPGINATHNGPGSGKQSQELDEIVRIISKFSQYLPEMDLPINLGSAPRILPAWNEAQSTARVDLSTIVDFLQSRAQSRSRAQQSAKKNSVSMTSAHDLQQMHSAACPPTSKNHASSHWRISEFCSKCTRRHSKGPIVTTWDKSLEVCYQPDIYHLHGFFMTDPSAVVLKELLPLFSASKMDGFSDIVFPMPSTLKNDADSRMSLSERKDELFWRGKVGKHGLSSSALRGSQNLRLMHLVTDPAAGEETTMVLPLPMTPGSAEEKKPVDKGSRKKKKKLKEAYRYEKVSTQGASAVLPFNVQLEQDGPCIDQTCTLIQQVYSPTEPAAGQAFEHRYILLADDDDGPPQGIIGALRSASVPFISTTFRTWYTERLYPWLHFVPIDTRFQALHTTLSYFTGIDGRLPLNGQNLHMPDGAKDAQWIASQGRKWAEKALGQKDLELYIFRLLLEWGRLIDDERDKVGFWQDGTGELQSSGWTPSQQETGRHDG